MVSKRVLSVFFISLILAGAISAASIESARAGETEDSQAGLSKAYNDFSKSMLADPTQDASKLSAQLVEPAGKKLTQAVSDTAVQTVTNARANNTPGPVFTMPPGGDVKKFKALVEKNGFNGPSGGAGPPGSDLAPSAPSQPSKPQVVLDGSNIPREIEFSGPKAVTPAPQPIH